MNAQATPRRRGRPAALDRDERRTLVLDALDRAYDDGGAACLTMDAVARSAGMSKRTLYGLFADRGALFIAYFDRLGQDFIRDLPPEAQGLPLEERLTMMLSPQSDCPTGLPFEILRCIIAEAPDRPDMASEFHRKVRGRAIAMVQAELDRSAQRGEIRSTDTALAAAMVLDIIKPNVLDHLMQPGALLSLPDRQKRFHQGLTMALRGLAG